ncbi:MAG: helix-turn-helix domain-containing protein [[Eubacterium] siraeum]
MRCNAMAASYKKLFKLLIDRDMKKERTRRKSRHQHRHHHQNGQRRCRCRSEVLVKICSALGCTMDDIVEIIEK